MQWFRVILSTLNIRSQLDYFREIPEKYLLHPQVKSSALLRKYFTAATTLQELAAPEQHNGTIRFTCGLFLFELGVAECIRQFKRQHPHIQFDVYLTESTMDLIDAQVDLALRITQKSQMV